MWEAREAARLDEMSQGQCSLRVTFMPDGDIALTIDCDGMPVTDEQGVKATVEFCSTAGGGGRSPRTREALFALLQAMATDNQADPSGIPPFPVYLAEQQQKAAGAQ